MSESSSEIIGGIVLCGGQSRRMGRPKMNLPFGNEMLLTRVVRILKEVVAPVVVVAADGQELPELPPDVRVVRDEQPGLGPLSGLATGLASLPESVTAAYASSCDVPLLRPEFVRRITQFLDAFDLAIPRDGQYHHPLAAVYRTSLAATIRELLAAGQLRPVFLLDHCRSRTVDVDQLREVDPQLDSLRNVNTPDEYAAALRDSQQ